MDSSTRPQSYGLIKRQILQHRGLAPLASDWSSDVLVSGDFEEEGRRSTRDLNVLEIE